MANPFPNEDQMWEHIKRGKVTIDPTIRELLNHHIRNDLNYISCGLGQYEFVPANILEAADQLIKKMCQEQAVPFVPPELPVLYKGTITRCHNITEFLNKIMRETEHEEGGNNETDGH